MPIPRDRALGAALIGMPLLALVATSIMFFVWRRRRPSKPLAAADSASDGTPKAKRMGGLRMLSVRSAVTSTSRRKRHADETDDADDTSQVEMESVSAPDDEQATRAPPKANAHGRRGGHRHTCKVSLDDAYDEVYGLD